MLGFRSPPPVTTLGGLYRLRQNDRVVSNVDIYLFTSKLRSKKYSLLFFRSAATLNTRKLPIVGVALNRDENAHNRRTVGELRTYVVQST